MASKRLFAVLLLLCLAGLFVGALEIREAKAVPIEVTRTFYSDTDDGYLQQTNYNYTIAHDAPNSLDVFDGYDSSWIGQTSTIGYSIYRSILFFDTSIISGVNVTSATLSIYIYQNKSYTDFNITIQTDDPHKPLVIGDYDYTYYTGNGGSRNTTEITALDYWNVTLNADGISWLNLEGTTKLCLRSSRDINSNVPSENEYVTFRTAEYGEAYSPRLIITYETEGYNYIVHGPYWESGSVAQTTVNVTLSIENTDPYTFMLNGTGGTADEENITIEQRGVAFTWNFTTAGNYTRTYYLTSVTFEEIWLYIPNVESEVVNLYTFAVTDFVGITNAYLETVHSVGGQNRIVERQSLDVINSVPFWMVWSHKYDMRLVCDQGTYTWGGFIAGAEMTQSLIIIEGMFPRTYPGLDVSVKAKRMNATWIQTNYTDNDEETDWVQVQIKYKSGYSWVTAYSTNNTGNTQQINWYSAEATKNYVVYVTASREGESKTWSFGCPKPEEEENPFEDTFEGLGDSWPFPPQYLIGFLLVLAVLGVFSYVNMPLGCLLALIMAAFLNLIGWLDINWNLLALGFAVAILAGIAYAKKEEREI